MVLALGLVGNSLGCHGSTGRFSGTFCPLGYTYNIRLPKLKYYCTVYCSTVFEQYTVLTTVHSAYCTAVQYTLQYCSTYCTVNSNACSNFWVLYVGYEVCGLRYLLFSDFNPFKYIFLCLHNRIKSVGNQVLHVFKAWYLLGWVDFYRKYILTKFYKMFKNKQVYIYFFNIIRLVIYVFHYFLHFLFYYVNTKKCV